jgi:hypothetical protein
LVFRQFLAASDIGVGAPVWPFTPDQDPTSNEVEIPHDRHGNRNIWTGTLALKGDAEYVEYSVYMRMTDDSSLVLDPIIIIRT